MKTDLVTALNDYTAQILGNVGPLFLVGFAGLFVILFVWGVVRR